MAEWSSRNIMLTTKGAAAISKVQSGMGKLTITKVVASEQYVPESTLREVTSLSVENLPLTIIDRHEVPDGGSVIQVQLNNLYLNDPFIFNEIGVFATHSDNPFEEFLYVIAQVDAGTGDRIPLYSATPITATYDIYLYNVSADNIEVTISSAGLVTYEALNEACGMVKRSTSYVEGDIRYSSSLPIPYYLKCKVAGTTSSSSVVIPSNIQEGTTITDGTVVWEAIKLVSTDELQTRNWKQGYFENLVADNGTIAGRNLADDGAMLDTHEEEITNLQSQITPLERSCDEAVESVRDLWGEDLIEKKSNGDLTISDNTARGPVKLILIDNENITFGDEEFFTRHLEYNANGDITMKEE